MKVSFVTTVLNEERTIKALLDSLLRQTKKPDEIIIVDAGSTDKTRKIIKNYPLKVKLIVKKDAKRSQARNLAIKQAKHSIITVSDAGNRLDENWLKLISLPFEDKTIDSVAGFYLTDTRTVFEQCVAPFVAVMPDKFNPKTFLPSSRSLAFTKKAWRKVGGYPPKLNTCEDLVFASQLKQKTNMFVEPQAIVHWRQAENFRQFFRMIRGHASGDIQARYQPHVRKIISIPLRYLLFIFLPWLLPLYFLWPIHKHYHYIKHPLAFIYLPLLQFTSDLAVITAVVI